MLVGTPASTPNQPGFFGTYDVVRLRRERLHKLQRAMAEHGVGALLLTNPVNVRYATGVAVMDLWTAVNLARYAVVPVEGEPHLFEYGKSLFIAQSILPSAKAAMALQFRFSQHEVDRIATGWAKEIKDILTQKGLQGSKLGYDVLDFYGHKALSDQGLLLTDADESVVAAKLLKTPDEIEFLRRSCAVAEAALYDLKHAIRPGVTENELFGVFWHKMLALGGEHCSTRLLTAGQKTNPWFYECGDNVVRPGDVVGIDTDMTGPEGYLCDISRTFLCGDKASAEQREAYRVAYDFVQATIELCRPGVTYEELVAKSPRVPEEYQPQGYSCMIHGSGYDDEPPFFPYHYQAEAGTGALIQKGVIQENMVLSVEFYAGKVGGASGVKLEEQILVTAKGPELMSKYPFEERLLR
jgi:Xaa-Pro aminopeptidase